MLCYWQSGPFRFYLGKTCMIFLQHSQQEEPEIFLYFHLVSLWTANSVVAMKIDKWSCCIADHLWMHLLASRLIFFICSVSVLLKNIVWSFLMYCIPVFCWSGLNCEIVPCKTPYFKVIWHKAASPPQKDSSVVFARWLQCALLWGHIMAYWHYLANTIELVLPLPRPSPQPKQQIDHSAIFAQLMAESPYTLQWASLLPIIAPSHGGIWIPMI